MSTSDMRIIDHDKPYSGDRQCSYDFSPLHFCEACATIRRRYVGGEIAYLCAQHAADEMYHADFGTPLAPTHREQAYADWRVSIGASSRDYCHPAFNAGYDAARALAEPLAEALDMIRSRAFHVADGATVTEMHDIARDAIATYHAALGSPVK